MPLLPLTARGMTGTSSSVLTGLLQANVRIKDASQLNLRQAHHFCVVRAFVMQRKFVVVDYHGVQTTLEPFKNLWVLLSVQEIVRFRLHLMDEI